MKRHLNQRMAALAHSEIRAMTQACVQANGLNMAQGVCDTPVPPVVLRAAAQAMERGKNVYSRFDGLPELRQAIAKKLAQYNGIVADPETDVTVSAGATGAFHCACLALLNPGDEVILFEPYYQYHISALMAVEAVPVMVKMQAPGLDLFRSRYRARDHATNQGDHCEFARQSFREGLRPARARESLPRSHKQHDLLVFTDEIYEYFLYDGRTHVSLATLPGMADRTITIGGYSKTFSITGWRIGYSVAAARVGTGDRSHERPALCLCPDAVAGGGGGGHPGTSGLVLPRPGARLSTETRSVLPGLGEGRSDAVDSAGRVLCAGRHVAPARHNGKRAGDVSP